MPPNSWANTNKGFDYGKLQSKGTPWAQSAIPEGELTETACLNYIEEDMAVPGAPAPAVSSNLQRNLACQLLVDKNTTLLALQQARDTWSQHTTLTGGPFPKAAALAQKQIDARKACTPKSCAQLGRQCGAGDDGCGGTLDCGACPAGTTCVGGKCVPSGGKLPGTEKCAVAGMSVQHQSECCAGLELRGGKCTEVQATGELCNAQMPCAQGLECVNNECALKAPVPTKNAGWIVLGTVAAAAVVGLGIWGVATAFRTNPSERAHNPVSRKFRVTRIPLDRGGYTRSGQYFGVGAPLFEYDDGERSDHVRAKDRAAAKAKIQAMYPGAGFYR